jgi:hypothetical protein
MFSPLTPPPPCRFSFDYDFDAIIFTPPRSAAAIIFAACHYCRHGLR